MGSAIEKVVPLEEFWADRGGVTGVKELLSKSHLHETRSSIIPDGEQKGLPGISIHETPTKGALVFIHPACTVQLDELLKGE